jgi:hypothetical protein
MKSIVFSPYIPKSILTKEILPGIEKRKHGHDMAW